MPVGPATRCILHGMHTHICTCGSTFCAFLESMAVPNHVVDEVTSIMDGKLPIHQKLTQVLQILQDHGLSQKQMVAPAAILVHPQNRGGTMISHHDAWKKGLAMLSVGLQKDLLHGSIGVQLSTDPQKRQSQVQKNQHLIHEAKNSLAPVSGHESNLGRRFHVFLIIDI